MTKIYWISMFLLLIPMLIHAQDPWKDIYRESAWEQRDSWQRADEIIARLNIKGGSKVADIGCHEGYFSIKLSKKVDAQGKVFAVDVSRDKIEKLKKHLADRDISNVVTVLAKEDDPGLPAGTLDAVLIGDTGRDFTHLSPVQFWHTLMFGSYVMVM